MLDFFCPGKCYPILHYCFDFSFHYIYKPLFFLSRFTAAGQLLFSAREQTLRYENTQNCRKNKNPTATSIFIFCRSHSDVYI